MRPKIRALVLAAGFGNRLRPLTERTPKPLLPIFGSTILEHSLAELAAVGCEAAAINLHYLGQQIRERLGDRFGDMALTYSEEPQIRGTLGALAPLKTFLASADVILVINGDSLCRWPLKRLLRKHQKLGASATLLFAGRANPALYGGGVAVDRRQAEVVSFDRRTESVDGSPEGDRPGTERLVFAGAHALSPDLLSAVPERVPCDTVRDLYKPLLGAGGRLGAVVTRRRWHDLGTPRRLLAGAIDFARGPWPWPRSWIGAGVEIGRRVKLRRVVVESDVRVATKARVSRAILLPGAEIGAGAVVIDSIVGPGAGVPAGAWIEGGIVTRRADAKSHPPSSSVIGDLVYTPFSEPGASL